MKQIEPIEDEMIEKWINIEKGTPLDGLWSHEWSKHGTCAATQISNLNSELKYFQLGLDLLDKYSISKLLDDTYIQPGLNKMYHVDEIFNALNLKIGNNFAIICEKYQGSQILFEIRICLDKNLNLHSCENIIVKDGLNKNLYMSDKIITNCKSNENILYPSQQWLKKQELIEQVKEKDSMYHVINIYKLVKLLQWLTI
jgi:ribonuclease T2